MDAEGFRPRDLFDLRGRTALVTGAAAGGLGARAAAVLASKGAAVVLADLAAREDDLARAAEAVDGPATWLACDVTDEAQVSAIVERVEAESDGIDILVHAAGVMLRRSLAETSLPEWRQVIDVNLTGTWLLNCAVGPGMTRRRSGKIVNVASVYADRVGRLPETAYYSSKAGIANLTRAVASEYGGRGVSVNCLAPGVFYPTGMTAGLGDDPEILEWMTERTLLKRLGDPHRDLDGALLLLASSASDYITGQVLYVDGGWSAW